MLCDVARWIGTSKLSDQESLVLVTIITAYLYKIKTVATEHMAEYGTLLPRNSDSPIYSELHLNFSSGSEK